MHTTRAGKTRRTEQEWRRLIEQFHKTGRSRREFCSEHGISVASLCRWEMRLRASRASFVEITAPIGARETRPAVLPWSAELELPGGLILRLRG